jgi:hypothetical protein
MIVGEEDANRHAVSSLRRRSILPLLPLHPTHLSEGTPGCSPYKRDIEPRPQLWVWAEERTPMRRNERTLEGRVCGPVRVVLIGETSVWTGVRMLLELEPGLRVTDNTDPEGESRTPAVILVELNEVGFTGVARLAALSEQIPGSAIVLLGLRTTPQLSKYALAPGATEFVGMDEGSDALLAAIGRPPHR